MSKGWLCFLVTVLTLVVCSMPGLAGPEEENDKAKATAFERHSGLFRENSSAAYNEEPLLDDRGLFSSKLLGIFDRADRWVGGSLHSKEYEEDTEQSFVTLAKDGAKLGYDF